MIGTIIPGLGLGQQSVFADELDDINYDPLMGHPVQVAPDFQLNAQSGETFAEGYIKFDIQDSNGYADSERLFLPDGAKVTLDGGSVLKVEGDQILLDGDPIASVNSEENGEGKALKVDLSAPLPNGNFEEGSVGEGVTVPSWTINHQSKDDKGNTVNQIWLGEKLATHTQGRTYESVVSNGDGTYTVTGPGHSYSYKTNVDYGSGKATTDDPQNVEGFEAVFNGWTTNNGKYGYVQNVNNDSDPKKSHTLEIGFLNASLAKGDYAEKDGKIASSFGIEAVSAPFSAKQGDKLSFDWKANDGGDDYEVYGFLVNEDTGASTEILYGRGSAQNWTTNSGEVPADGNYRFRFVAGSFNRTDGTTHGATLSIDNVRVVSSKVVKGVVDAIAQLVQYENTQYSGDRPVKISVVNSEGKQSTLEDDDVKIMMSTKSQAADALKSSLKISVPTDKAYIYDPNQKGITGSTEPGSTVNVSVTSPNGNKVYNGPASVDDNGKWTITLDDSLSKGEYTIQATSSKGGATSDPKQSTFTFVDKTNLERYYNEVKNLKQEDYQDGWVDDDTDSDIEFASALQAAKALLDDITDSSSTSNPDQVDVDKALQDLQKAKENLVKLPPEEQSATFEHGSNQITLDFDKAVKFADQNNAAEGFTVTVDGKDYPVLDATAKGDKLTLTVDGTLSAEATEVKVNYDRSQGRSNVYGDEDNGAAVETFERVVTDPFYNALQIQSPKGNTDDPKPAIEGTVDTNADSVKVSIKDINGDNVVNNADAILENGHWTLELPDPLAPGEYSVEATATQQTNGRSLTKSQAFTIVDKKALNKEYDEVKGFDKDNYRAGWVDFKQARDHASEVLADPTASQDEVDQALINLHKTREALEKYPPQETDPATYEHGAKAITIDFDKKVELIAGNPSQGFTVIVDGESYKVTDANAHGDKVTLTVDQPLDSDAKKVVVEYTSDSTQPNLLGDEENGTSVQHFSITATDAFGAGLQIKSTKGNTDNQTPTFTGAAHTDADRVTLTFYDSHGNVIEDLQNVEAKLNTDDTWSYKVPEGSKLRNGKYTFTVTAVNNDSGRRVTKSASFTIVDKTALNKEYEDVKDFDKDDYRSGWDGFKEAQNHATEVLADPTSSQDEVDQALTELKAKREALEKYPPVETSPATYEHGQNKVTIDFDKNVILTAEHPTEGFTVKVDGKKYKVTEAIADGDKVKLTVDRPLDSDAKKVVIEYAPDSNHPNLFGDEENGTVDEPFKITATDEFGKGLQINGTKGNTDNRTPPFTGKVHKDADSVTVTIVDVKGQKYVTDADAVIKGENWSFEDWDGFDALEPGHYTVQVTAKDDKTGRMVTKSVEFTVVDKAALQKETEEVSEFKKEDYRTGWDDFVVARDHATDVLADPNASQAEVNESLTELKEKREALEKVEPKAIKATFDHGHDEITVSFDKAVKFTGKALDAKSGFTVTVNGKEVKVINAELVNIKNEKKTNKIKLTLEKGTELSSDTDVQVIYDKEKGQSNIVGDEENSTPVEDFNLHAGDPFGHALQIDQPNGITNDITPDIKGTVDKDAESAIMTITGPNGKKVIVNKEELTINPDGTWTYTIEDTLVSGEYQVEVTTFKSGHQSVTKYHNFIVVDKEALYSLKEGIKSKALNENDYTNNSWKNFEDAYSNAKAVFDDPKATQAEVDQAVEALSKAYDALVDTKALADEVKKSDKLVSSNYSKASWYDYQKALKNAQKLLNNPAATQEAINKAKALLETARQALAVDKAQLKEEEILQSHLSAKDYTKASWKAYQKALEHAKAVIADPQATQMEVDAALKSLQKAESALKKSDQRNDLPETASNTYNWLLLSAVFLIIGFTLIVSRRKRQTKN